MTKQERKSAYLEAKERITNYIGFNFLCGQFADILSCRMDECTTLLPEFGLFEPNAEENQKYSLGICWFGYKDEDGPITSKNAEWQQMERLICLDLCLLMVEDDYLEE